MTKSITVAERQTRDFAEKKYTVGSRSRRLGLAGCESAASESGARVGGCVCHLRAGCLIIALYEIIGHRSTLQTAKR
jgi:hypothetical protein